MTGAEGMRRPAARAKPVGTARGLALEILDRVEARGAFADRLLDRRLDGSTLDARDRALATELVLGTLRWQRRLDWQLGRVSRRPLGALTGWVRALLRLSAYQLGFLDRVPPWAAVSEAVELAKGRRPPGAAEFVNGVLRALAAVGRPWPEPVAPADGERDEVQAIALSQPTWLYRRWVTRYGEPEAAVLARAMNQRPPLGVRVNTLRSTAEAVADAFERGGARVTKCRHAPDGLVIDGLGDPRAAGPIKDGLAVVQDEGAILVGHVVGPEPGETVADVCAAPGTKTTHLAQLMGNRGRLLAADPEPARLAQLRAACAATGSAIVEARPVDVETLAREIGPACDRVLADAPCSNLGVLRRNPDGKWRRQEAELAALGERQAAILVAAAGLVRPGGVLVYATCSLEPEENEEVIRFLRARYPEFVPDPVPAAVPEACRATPEMLRVFPHRHGADGFTAVRLRRCP